jgi:hypothetical protein
MLKVCIEGGELFSGPGSRCSIHKLGRGLRTESWARQREAQLAAYPWCADCITENNTYVRAIEVHHPNKRSSGGPLITDVLISLCHVHHGRRTARGE